MVPDVLTVVDVDFLDDVVEDVFPVVVLVVADVVLEVEVDKEGFKVDEGYTTSGMTSRAK